MTTPALHIEAKYTYPAGIERPLEIALEASCARDAEHPSDVVNSIYYDTPDRIHLYEKVNSDYLKAKIRLRWYGDESDQEPSRPVAAFFEVKSKQGVVRTKNRLPMDIPGELLRVGEESFEELEHLAIHARECGLTPNGPLFPMIAIRYRRFRFCEFESGSRVSLDCRIACTGVNQQFFPRMDPRTLRRGVLEIKSSTGLLPRAFSAIRPFLNRRDSFSKYEQCWQMHADPLY